MNNEREKQAQRLQNIPNMPIKESQTPEIIQFIVEKKDRIVQAWMGNRVKAERFINHIITVTNAMPELLKTTKKSFFNAVMAAANLGLMPQVANECWILPYYDSKSDTYRAQFIIGYKGYIKMFYRSPLAKLVWFGRVYKGDEVNLRRHVENMGGKIEDDSRELLGWYAAYELTTGGMDFVYMSLEQIEAMRLRSAAKNSPAWRQDYDAMCIKTVLRHLLKYAPLETEDMTAMEKLDGAVKEYDEVVVSSPANENLALMPDFWLEEAPEEPKYEAGLETKKNSGLDRFYDIEPEPEPISEAEEVADNPDLDAKRTELIEAVKKGIKIVYPGADKQVQAINRWLGVPHIEDAPTEKLEKFLNYLRKSFKKEKKDEPAQQENKQSALVNPFDAVPVNELSPLQLKQKEIIDLINTIVPDWDRDNYINIVLSNENEKDLDIVRNRLIRLFGGEK